jgi:hypothetical protein
MKTPPPLQKRTQDDWVKTALRLPKALHAEIQAAADDNVHSMNAEILQRLETRRHQELMDELADVKAMLRRVLDRT